LIKWVPPAGFEPAAHGLGIHRRFSEHVGPDLRRKGFGSVRDQSPSRIYPAHYGRRDLFRANRDLRDVAAFDYRDFLVMSTVPAEAVGRACRQGGGRPATHGQ